MFNLIIWHMTKRKRISICILMKLLAASSARLSAVLPITLLVVLLSFSPYTVMQAVERDSLYTFQFVPKQGMLYISYKKNSVELERLLLLIRQHQNIFLPGISLYLSVASVNLHLSIKRTGILYVNAVIG